MANVREQSKPTTNSKTTTVGNESQVDVYDTDQTSATGMNRDTGSMQRTDTTPTTPIRSDIEQPGVNWGAIILGILVLAALIFLLMWLF